FTPRDEKAVKTAASTLRRNPKLDVERAITELAVGEALVSLLDEKGRPQVVERALIAPPGSRIGPATAQERSTTLAASPIRAHYAQSLDRESAYERLNARQPATAPKIEAPTQSEESGGGSLLDQLGGIFGGGSESTRPTRSSGRSREGVLEAAAKSAARAMGSEMGRQILRGVLGSILGGSRRRR
ncbi:MAG: helicase HerA-like domain-containing protein, partial [Burkholderiales bacterium]